VQCCSTTSKSAVSAIGLRKYPTAETSSLPMLSARRLERGHDDDRERGHHCVGFPGYQKLATFHDRHHEFE
jgi:hypothetical protein